MVVFSDELITAGQNGLIASFHEVMCFSKPSKPRRAEAGRGLPVSAQRHDLRQRVVFADPAEQALLGPRKSGVLSDSRRHVGLAAAPRDAEERPVRRQDAVDLREPCNTMLGTRQQHRSSHSAGACLDRASYLAARMSNIGARKNSENR